MRRASLLIGAIILMFASIMTASAMGKSNMSSMLADLTGKSEEEIQVLREEKTYGEIAKDEEVYDEFKEARTALKFAHIDQKVEDGKLSLEEGEQFKARFLEKSQNCDGEKVKMNMGKGQRRGV